MPWIKFCWSESRTYRVWLFLAIIYFILRLVIQVYLFADAIRPEAIAKGTSVSADLQMSYIPASEHFKSREDIYLKGSLDFLEAQFPYSPSFAFFGMPLLLQPLSIQVPLLTLIHLIAYWLLYVKWASIFKRYELLGAEKVWAMSLPLFLIFSAFWDDLAYLNMYLLMALFATYATDAVIQERTVPASFWLGAVILPIKPQWAFALGIPLLLGRNRFFFKLIGGTILAYAVVMVITMMGGGATYVLQQYRDYVDLLARLSRDYPWRGPDQPFLGYNHSVMQTILYFFGVTPANLNLATVIKFILLAPLGWVAMKFLRNPLRRHGSEIPELALTLGFALYLGAFIWLDMVWEVSLGLVIFVFLLAIIEQEWIRTALWVIFLPYAALDAWRLISYLAFGDRILYEGAYVLTDPFLYVPWILMILLVFYALIIQRLRLAEFRLA